MLKKDTGLVGGGFVGNGRKRGQEVQELVCRSPVPLTSFGTLDCVAVSLDIVVEEIAH